MRNVIPMNMQNYTLSRKIFIITNYPFYTKHISSIPCDINRDMATFLFSYVSRARSNKHWFWEGNGGITFFYYLKYFARYIDIDQIQIWNVYRCLIYKYVYKFLISEYAKILCIISTSRLICTLDRQRLVSKYLIKAYTLDIMFRLYHWKDTSIFFVWD